MYLRVFFKIFVSGPQKSISTIWNGSQGTVGYSNPVPASYGSLTSHKRLFPTFASDSLDSLVYPRFCRFASDSIESLIPYIRGNIYKQEEDSHFKKYSYLLGSCQWQGTKSQKQSSSYNIRIYEGMK